MENPLAFVIRPGEAESCHVQLVDAQNHELVFWAGSYHDIRSARQAIMLAKRNVATAPVIDQVSTLLRRLKH